MGVRTKNHMNPTPITMPGKEKDKKLNDSNKPDAFVLIFTIVYATKIDKTTPRVAPKIPRNRLFFNDKSEIGSLITSDQ